MKLGDWLKGDEEAVPPRRRMTQAEFARRIGASVTLITAYLDGSVWPGGDKMDAIERETEGAVTPNDFLDVRRAFLAARISAEAAQ